MSSCQPIPPTSSDETKEISEKNAVFLSEEKIQKELWDCVLAAVEECVKGKKLAMHLEMEEQKFNMVEEMKKLNELNEMVTKRKSSRKRQSQNEKDQQDYGIVAIRQIASKWLVQCCKEATFEEREKKYEWITNDWGNQIVDELKKCLKERQIQ
ncbi:hypothetical protein RFI_09988 [Reticulomyxa filosa]|uniref:Uncharacterized protein n=1 Tax=Reticulomyxa filosa TaxID=46433 RepID=X6NLI4_RETFI|nr:hypothetical protein RFI_09988 [Reticulomyxa filosa]|eukprot:ETO27145.1 hypothetical protein RFI_09988 [Reticulomyxa filosa]